jgi:hypothetical protein
MVAREECRKLKDMMVNAESSYRTFHPDFGGHKPKSKWPKEWRDESRNLELASNLPERNTNFIWGLTIRMRVINAILNGMSP